MTRDEVLRLAREAGIVAIHADGASNWSEEVEVLERFAALVSAAEREMCAKVCEDIDVERTEYCMSVYEEGEQYKSAAIEAIRARGSHA